MKEKINWQKELLESGKFNDKFSKNLLEHGAKNFMQGIYLGYMYSRWRKIRDLDKDDLLENTCQMQSLFKEFEKKIKCNDTYFLIEESESPHYKERILRNPPTRNFVYQISTNTLKLPTNIFMQIFENIGLYWTNRFYKIPF